jgi:tetraacyldisaccharide 4'-kinase
MTTDAPRRENEASAPRAGPLPRLLRPLGAFEPVYRWAVSRRNRSFDRGERVWRAPYPVISVGNLSVGGTGKTPVVMRLAREMLLNHLRPVIAMRGYAKSGDVPSDEEAEYLETLEGVRVLAHPDRAGSIAAFHASAGKADCVILDDGFQHRFVARDLDIVLIDATRSPFDDRLLPAGWLREPVESLGRAGAIVVTRADRVGRDALGSLLGQIGAHAQPGVPIATCAHRWGRLDRFRARGESIGKEPAGWLARRRVFALSGIGNPGAFRGQVERDAGAQVVGERALADHASYSAALVASVAREAERRGAESIVTTSKDWVKIRRFVGSLPDAGPEWVVPRVEIEFLDGGDALLGEVVRVASANRDRAEDDLPSLA